MKYAVEMGSGAMIEIPTLINIGSDIKKLIGGIRRHTDEQSTWRSQTPFFIFSK
jgi:hypothetical protein